MRTTLIAALADIAAGRRGAVARFLQGLSADELQYLAEFFGACTLEPGEPLAERLAAFERAKRPNTAVRTAWTADQDHKLILLHEYLVRCGLAGAPRAMHAG